MPGHRIGAPRGRVVGEQRVRAEIIGQRIGCDLDARLRRLYETELVIGVRQLQSGLRQIRLSAAQLISELLQLRTAGAVERAHSNSPGEHQSNQESYPKMFRLHSFPPL